MFWIKFLYILKILLTKNFEVNAEDDNEDIKLYHSCLQKQENLLNESEFYAVPTQAKIVEEGSGMIVTCDYCYLPKETKSKIIWYQLKREGITKTIITKDEKNYKIRNSINLEIVHAKKEDSGFYFCTSKDVHQAVYNIDVVKRDTRIEITETSENRLQDSPTEFADYNLVLYTEWSEWSICNRCDKVGKRRRIGICYIKKINHSEAIEPRDIPMFKSYPNGIPCFSSYVPKTLRKLVAEVNRTSYFHVGFCKVPCPTEPPLQIPTDESGNYVMKDFKLPTLPPRVGRETIYEMRGKSIFIPCPGRTSHAIVDWKNGSRMIQGRLISARTKGRVLIDERDTLHIRRLHLSDSGTYSCFINGRLVGSVKLSVTTGLKKTASHYSSLITTFLILTTIIVLGCYLVLSGKRE